MIVGVGIDLVEIERMRAVLERHDEAFIARILHESEDRARFDRGDGATHLAGIFAAKEAVMKALGTGMAGAPFSDIRIAHKEGGQPYVELSGLAAETAAGLGVTAWQMSITHSKTTAAAVAIALTA